MNDFLDRHHQRQLDEFTYSAAIAEIRSLKGLIASYHPHVAGERCPVLAIPPEMMAAEVMVESDVEDEDLIAEPRTRSRHGSSAIV